MTERLPIGAEAAAARRRTVGHYADYVEQELPDETPDDVRNLLAQVREDPLDSMRWTNLSAALHGHFVRGINAGTYEQWRRPGDWAKQGSYMAWKMYELARADAPICDEHGPMVDSTDPAVQESHDGHRWHCAGAPRCRAGYWWIDGTHLIRTTRIGP